MTNRATVRRPAGGDRAPDRPNVAWLGVAALVYAGSVAALLGSPVTLPTAVTGATLTVVMLGAGAIIVLRTEVPSLGWLLVATGATINYFSAAEAVEPATRTDAQVLWVSIIGVSPVFLIAVIILFPTGRATTLFSRIVLLGGVGTQVVSHGLQVVAATGLIGGDWNLYRRIADTGVAVTVMAVLVMHLVTYRRRPRVEQLQLKYLVLALLFSAVGFLISGSGGAVMLGDGVSREFRLLLDSIGPGLVPIAIVLAMTRYRLYDIDRFISRTLAYALVLGLLGLLFVGSVATIANLLPTQDRLAVALTTVAVVALFDPLRRRIVDAVDRRFDRTRYVARQVVEDFGRDVQDITDLDEIGQRLHAVVSRTVAPATVAVWEPGAPR